MNNDNIVEDLDLEVMMENLPSDSEMSDQEDYESNSSLSSEEDSDSDSNSNEILSPKSTNIDEHSDREDALMTENPQDHAKQDEEIDSDEEFMTEIIIKKNPIKDNKNKDISNVDHAQKVLENKVLIENKNEVSSETTTPIPENKNKPSSEDIDMEEAPEITTPTLENMDGTNLTNASKSETQSAEALSEDKHKDTLKDVEITEAPEENTGIPVVNDQSNSNNIQTIEPSASFHPMSENILRKEETVVEGTDETRHQPENIDKLRADNDRQTPSTLPDFPLSIGKMYKAPYMDKFYYTQEAYEAISLNASPNETIQKMKETTSFASFLNLKKQFGQEKTIERNDKGTRPAPDTVSKETHIPVPVRHNMNEGLRMGSLTLPSHSTSPKALHIAENSINSTKPTKPEFSLDALLESITDRPADPIPPIEKPPVLAMKRKSRPDKKYPKNNKPERNTLSDIEVAAMAAGL
ncbi:hypothetical protein F4703DRAFT_1477962 [Phycomyces blakesleeanus]